MNRQFYDVYHPFKHLLLLDMDINNAILFCQLSKNDNTCII